MSPALTRHQSILQPPERAAVFCALCLAAALASLSACSAPPHRSVTIDLPPGRSACLSAIPIPADADEVVIDGHGTAILVGGIDIESPDWRQPDAALLARLPAESRERVRVLEIPDALLAPWPEGLHGPVHSGHAVRVPFSATEVFVGGEALMPARWPNEGWATIERVIDPGTVPRNDEPDMPPEGRLREPPRGGTFVPTDASRLERWTDAEDAWLSGYWNWDWSEETLPLASVDPTAGTVALGLPHRYGLADRGRFRITNVLAELDAPGECWIDRADRRVVAWLPEGGESARVTISMREAPFIEVPTGDGAPRLVVRGVGFESTRGAAIEGRGVHGTTIESCTFLNIGATAVDLEGEDCLVSRSHFESIGSTGVRLSGGDRRLLRQARNRVEDSVFLRTGRLERSYRPAIDLSGVGQSASHNEIAHLPHFAILFAGCEHTIEHNHIHHVVEETGDAGAVYVGRDYTTQGTVLRGNLVHDVEGSDARYQNAFYLDDMSSGIVMEDNLFVRCNWGILIGGGRDNIVRDNAFAACGQAVVYDARGVGWMAYVFEDPETCTILRRLAETPVDEEPWRSRYPLVRTYLDDRFARPVGGVVEGNALLGSSIGSIEDPTLVRVSGTIELSTDPGEDLEATCARLIERATKDEIVVGRARLGPVGPRKAIREP